MKNTILSLLLLSLSQICFSQIVNIPDTNFKTALLNYNPVIDTNGDNEIQVSEANQFTGTLSVTGENINDLIGIQAFTNITQLRANVNNLTQIDISQNVNLEVLNIRENNIATIDLTNNVNLTTVILSENNLSNIDVSQNALLFRLDCGLNQLTTLDVSQNAMLNVLSCSSNQLTNLDVSQNTALNTLRCSGNQFTNLDVSQNPMLEILSCSNNQLSNLDFSQNALLQNVECSYNQLTSLNFSQNGLLQALTCSNNQITSIDVSQNDELQFLYCWENQLTTLDVTQNPALLYFICSNNQLTNLDVTQNPLLRDLRCNDNQLTTLDVTQNIFLGEFNFFDSLNCSRNLLTTLDLSNNINLYKVIVTENYFLESINLKNGNNTNIDTLNAEGCPNLETICVDDIGYATANFSDLIEPQTIFVEDCNATTINYNIISGNIQLDDENDGCDVNDISLQNLMVQTTDGTNTFSTFTNENGEYAIDVAENTYDTSLLNLPSYFSSNPTMITDTFVGFNNTETADFCITSNQTNINDISVILLPIGDARPGFDARYRLVYQNMSILPISGTLSLLFDDTMQSFVAANPSQSSSTTNTITFNYANLLPFESRFINITMNTNPPPIVNGDDILNFTATISPTANDIDVSNNTYDLQQIVVNSFDPNDKQVLQGNEITLDEVDEYLDYVIRFQNTGTASAINVVITDELDDKLDWNTIQPISASHPYNVRITNGNFVEFIFENINLPDSTTDEPNSNGFIAFKIKPKSDVIIGDIITGEAKIYFDYNLPIITNTVSTEIFAPLSVEEFKENTISIYPNPAKDVVTVQSKFPIKNISIFDINGKVVESNKLSRSQTEHEFNIGKLPQGIYFMKIQTEFGIQTQKIIKE